MQCSKCQHKNPEDARFCNRCGHNLTPISEQSSKAILIDEKIAKIQRYLPKGLTERILSQKDKIEGERKRVTVMFCDMEGFTSMVEKWAQRRPTRLWMRSTGSSLKKFMPMAVR